MSQIRNLQRPLSEEIMAPGKTAKFSVAGCMEGRRQLSIIENVVGRRV